MNVIQWLEKGDYTIKRMTSKYLLKNEITYKNEGHIKRYLDLYNKKTRLWGEGVYGPKWISTHYTMLELKDMEVDSGIEPYQNGLGILIDELWREETQKEPYENYDMCILGMLVSLCSYGKSKEKRVYEMIDEILAHQMADGGWNCYWNYKRRPSIRSSFHTTLTILEGLRDFNKLDQDYRKDEIKERAREAQTYLLSRELLYAKSSGELLSPAFKTAHYPPRWKYDYLRALEYFASIDYQYDSQMDRALCLIESAFDKYGYMLKGSQYAGKRHYQLEETKGGRFNTLRALKVLKKYRPIKYEAIIKDETKQLK